MKWRIRGVLLAALPGVLLAGCWGRGPYPVRGIVTLDGKPVAGATVVFVPDGDTEGRPATGYTAADGTFRLTTFRTDDGALSGSYRVVVQKTVAAKDKAAADQSALDRAKAKRDEKSLQRTWKSPVPENYSNSEFTPLRCTVPVQGVVTLDLHKNGKP
jgi:hypothetical protein